MNPVLQQILKSAGVKVARKPQPAWIAPMLATLTEQRFTDDRWVFEMKLDGQRALAFRKGKQLQLLSRNRLSLNSTYPEVVKSVASQKEPGFILDGEIVAFEKGLTSFAKLQQRMKLSHPSESLQKKVPVYYFVFDLLYFDGYDLRKLPLLDRKRLLNEAFEFNEHLRFTDHRPREGETYYEEACRKKWEGIVAKRADSPYVSQRSKDWLKWKCVQQQEFVIGGYTEPAGQRKGFGALLVGYYEDGTLKYAGKVGTGYTEEMLRTLSKKLQAIKRATPALRGTGLPLKGVHWVEPKLVAQIGFTEWTSDRKLRHPRFLGLRTDKSPREVVFEPSQP